PKDDPQGHRHPELRELSAGDVRQALASMAAEYSSATVTMGHLALKRAIRHKAMISSPGTSRPWSILPRARKGPVEVAHAGAGRGGHRRRPESASPRTASRLERRPPPGHSDVRLRRAEPAGRGPHREARALRWDHVELAANSDTEP